MFQSLSQKQVISMQLDFLIKNRTNQAKYIAYLSSQEFDEAQRKLDEALFKARQNRCSDYDYHNQFLTN